jgi:hypothetical protein
MRKQELVEKILSHIRETSDFQFLTQSTQDEILNKLFWGLIRLAQNNTSNLRADWDYLYYFKLIPILNELMEMTDHGVLTFREES